MICCYDDEMLMMLLPCARNARYARGAPRVERHHAMSSALLLFAALLCHYYVADSYADDYFH